MRKNVSSACQACKKSRAKCDERDPCDRCASREMQCVRREEGDRRRKELRKRTMQDLQEDSNLLHSWIDTIRHSKDVQVMQIVSIIRSNASTDEVKACIKQDIRDAEQKRRQSSPDLERLQSQIHELHSQPPRRRRKMDVSRMIDEPPHRVSAAPWTNVTDDDILVSNLVSVWLIWDKSIFNWIDEGLFLRDMSQGRLGSTFCSPFMVNSLLANACPFSDYEEARTRQGKISPLMSDFLYEARRLLRETNGEASITTAQGLGFMYLASMKLGNIAASYDYICQAISMCKDLESKDVQLSDGSAEFQERSLMSKTLQKTCWGLFSLLITTCIFLRKPSVPFPEPQHPLSKPAGSFVESVPYPQSNLPVAFHFDELRYQYASLSLIVQDIVPLLLQRTSREDSHQNSDLDKSTIKIYERALEWRISLPSHLRFNEASPPSVLMHEANYFVTIITIFNSVKQDGDRSCTEAAAKAHRISKDAALRVVDICRLWQSLYGSTMMNMYFTGVISVALDILVGQADMHKYSAEITDLCVCLRSISRRFPFSMATLRAFQLCVQQSGKSLPAATEKLFHEFEQEEWSKSEMQQKMSLVPVVGDQNAERREDVHDLRDFFDMMGSLKIDDESNT